MRTFVTLLVASLVGVAAGIATAVARIEYRPWNGDPSGSATPAETIKMPSLGDPLPKVVVSETQHDFGTMDLDNEGSHDFTFTNAGQGDLILSPGGSTCRCTVPKIEKPQVPPGESTKVAVKWRFKEDIGSYHETATIRTNDPSRPLVRLAIVGRVTVAARPVPAEMVLSRVSPTEPASDEVAVFCYVDEPFEIISAKPENPQTAQFYDVAWEPLAADRLQAEAGAKSGYLVKVSVKPGLPLGAFQQRILLRTSLRSRPEVAVPVTGSVGKDITVAGPGWDKELGVVMLGTVSSTEGAKRRLLLVARGPHYKEVRFKLVRIVPDLLKVTLGEPTAFAGGKATQTPLAIQIPKGSPRGNHLGSALGRLGEITLETNHPDDPKLRIRVSFAVGG